MCQVICTTEDHRRKRQYRASQNDVVHVGTGHLDIPARDTCKGNSGKTVVTMKEYMGHALNSEIISNVVIMYNHLHHVHLRTSVCGI